MNRDLLAGNKHTPYFNHFILEGHVTHTPEYWPDKSRLLTFSLAHNSAEHVAGIDNPMYLDIRVTGISEETAKAIVVGHRIRVTGRLQCKSWTKDGEKQRHFFLYVPHPANLELLHRPQPKTVPTEQAA